MNILDGIADLSIGVEELLGVMGAYVPSITNAGVKYDVSTVEATSGAAIPDEKNPGLVVTSTRMDMLDSQSGSAGGFIGYGSGRAGFQLRCDAASSYGRSGACGA